MSVVVIIIRRWRRDIEPRSPFPLREVRLEVARLPLTIEREVSLIVVQLLVVLLPLVMRKATMRGTTARLTTTTTVNRSYRTAFLLGEVKAEDLDEVRRLPAIVACAVVSIRASSMFTSASSAMASAPDSATLF